MNTGDFGVGNTGLLELTIGDDGITSRIGTNGTNMSMGTIVSALNGIEPNAQTAAGNKIGINGYDGVTSGRLYWTNE